jgi:ligand-binding sensor domain-containing protein/DNA-binding CsgD family transcriptional regulator
MRIITVLFLTCIGVISQELPPIQSFSPDIYKGGNQNWNITQDDNQNMYFANNDGMLRYDGNHWQLFPSPNKSILRSVHYANNLIYSGSYMDFGYWKYLQTGELIYSSIVDELAFEMIEDEQIWNIFDYKQFVIFQTLNRLIIYNFLNKQTQVISSDDNILKAFLINNDIYFQSSNKSIYIVSEGKQRKLINGKDIQDLTVVNIFINEDGIYFISDTKGFFHIKNNKIVPTLINSFPQLNNSLIYSAVKTESENYVLGSVMDGILIFDKTGNLIFNYTSRQGLANNTVLSTFIDNQDNLWAGLDNGIAHLQLNSPIRIYKDSNGSLGTIYASSLYNGVLYLGTNQGLFKKVYPSDSDFSPVLGLEGQVWNLKQIDGKLFCGHDSGMFIIDNHKVTKLFDKIGTWDYRLLENNLIIAGTYDGLHIIEKNGSNWKHKTKIEQFDISSRFFEISKDKTILISHEYKGVFRIKLNKNNYEIDQTDLLVDGQSLYSSLSSLGDSIYFMSNEGFFYYDYDKDEFLKNNQIMNLMKDLSFLSGKMVNTNDKNLWLFGANSIIKLEKNQFSNEFILEKFPISQSLRSGLIGFENIISLDNSSHLLGSSQGYIVLNQGTKQSAPEINLSINSVLATNKDKNAIRLDLNLEQELSYDFNSLEFLISLPNYDNTNEIEFRHKLKGYEDEWSSWKSDAKILFSNLDPGKYELFIQAQKGNDIISTKSYSFNIDNPWYLSSLAYIFYIMLLIAFSLTINLSYTKYYKREQNKIISANAKKLELIEFKNKEEMMRLRNSNLQESVESKNRELAAATMATIKNNKFLQQIIVDLKSLKSINEINSVLVTIKRNLDKGDDWKFFEEAFNNTDQNFIKNLKNLHPKLTQSDLKLCAYLRLNLSTKEIAPLFGISVRSVEIKRYRLRKKMNLKSGVTLIDHIVSIS